MESSRCSALVPFRCDSPCGVRQIGAGKFGADARFPPEEGRLVGYWNSPDPNGVQGIAGSNPAVPIANERHRKLLRERCRFASVERRAIRDYLRAVRERNTWVERGEILQRHGL